MKKTSITILLLCLASAMSYGQSHRVVDIDQGSRLGRIQSSTNRPGNFLIPVPHLRLKTIDRAEWTEEDLKLDKKKYLSYNYDLASVDDYDTKAYIRYNIFDDQMEFVKEESIYYLAKEAGRKVKFINSNTIYRVYDFENDQHFLKVLVDADNSLIVKQRVRYIDAKVANTGYDVAKPANYKRVKDEYFLALDNKTLVKLPKSKKGFIKAFGDQSSKIKSYMKENKLGYKREKDLAKIVNYYNSL